MKAILDARLYNMEGIERPFRSSLVGDDLIKLDSISVRPSVFFSSGLDET